MIKSMMRKCMMRKRQGVMVTLAKEVKSAEWKCELWNLGVEKWWGGGGESSDGLLL